MDSPADLARDAGFRTGAARLAELHGLELLVLFGSHAAGRARPDSDVDVAVRAAGGPLGTQAWMALDEGLAKLLPGRRVDLVDLTGADPLLLRQIFRHAVLLFERTGGFAAARLHAFHRYQDYRPFLRLERDAVRRALGFQQTWDPTARPALPRMLNRAVRERSWFPGVASREIGGPRFGRIVSRSTL